MPKCQLKLVISIQAVNSSSDFGFVDAPAQTSSRFRATGVMSQSMTRRI